MKKRITMLLVGAIASYATVSGQTFNYTGSLQHISVPACSDSAIIETYGAQGGGDVQDAAGGMGAKIVGKFKVTPNHVLAIMVGGQGLDDPYNGFGGGGGSFVWDSSVHDTLMIAAGGGGGAGVDNSGSVGGAGSATTTPTTGWNGAYTAAGGVGGNGGDSGTNGTGQYAGGGGGAGWYSNGVDGQVGSSSNPSGHGGVHPLAGGAGGTAAANWGAAGGYGGGGGSGIDGGGGGYNGGGGSNAYPIGGTSGSGGGGGSYNGGTNQTNVAGFQSGNGMVVITFINTTHDLSPVMGADSVCQGAAFLYTCTHYAGATFTWTGPAGSVISSGQGTDSAMITFGATTGFVVVSGASACGNDKDSIRVTVTPLPVVTMHATIDSICKSDSIDALIGAPLGGTFSGAGVSGSNFNPKTAGVGSHVIHYSFTNPEGCTSMDSTVVIVNNCVTGINEQGGISSQVSMYPNPFSQSLTVNIAADGQSKVSILNMLGETVGLYMVDKGTHTMNTENLPAGVYSVRIETAQGGILTQKLVKIQ